MKRHESAVPLDTDYQKRAFTRNPQCSCGESFGCLNDFWRHQAEEYERLMAHYTHLFEPKEQD